MSVAAITLSNIVQLKNYNIDNTTCSELVEILGYFEDGDGGGGSFYWDPNHFTKINFGSGYTPNSPQTISVEPIPQALSIGDVIYFEEGGILVLTAMAMQNAPSITGFLNAKSVSSSEKSKNTIPLSKINNPGGYAIGATSITVDALPVELPNQAVLTFQNGGVFTLNAAAAKNATTITGVLTDHNVGDDEKAIGVKINNTGGYTIGATSMTVDALPVELPDQAVLTFQNGGVFTLNAAAAKNATTITGVLTDHNVGDNEEAAIATINNPGGYAIGSTSMSVDSLPEDLSNGTILNFKCGGVFTLDQAATQNDTTISGVLSGRSVYDNEETVIQKASVVLSSTAYEPFEIEVEGISNALRAGDKIDFQNGGTFELTASAIKGATTLIGNLTGEDVSDDEEGFLADNGGTILKPGYGTYNGIGRWIRQEQSMVSVRWFGAKGDGTTDDTDAIQRTINYCRTFKKVVHIPQGDYKVSNQFTVPSTLTGVAFGACLDIKTSISIIGDGIGKSVLSVANTADTVFASSNQFVLNVTIEGLSLVGSASALSDGCGIRLGHEDTSSGQVFYESRISDVKITGFGLNAIRTPNEFNNEYNRIIAGNCYGHILYIEGDTGTQLNNCRIEEVPTAGRAGYRLLRGGILSACNGTKSGSNDNHLWGSFGNEAGQEPENTALCNIGGRYQLDECNIEHWVTQALKINYSTVRVLLNSPKIFQNGSIAGNIVVTRDIADAGKLRIWNMELILAGGLLHDAHIKCYQQIDVLTDSNLTVYATNWSESFKAGRIYGSHEQGDPGFAYLPNLKSNNLVATTGAAFPSELGFGSGKVFMDTFTVPADVAFSRTIITGTNDFVNIFFAFDSTVSSAGRHLFMNSIAQVGTSDAFITELNSVNKTSPESGTISITKTGTKDILINKTAGSESVSGTVFLYVFGKFISIS